ncbi:MAG: hypothetical protein ABIR08_04745 [Sphingomonas sp.]
MLAYAGFTLAAIAVFALRPAREAAAWSYFGGWLILPVAAYPPFFQSMTVTPIEIMGLVLPADMLISKAAAIAAATCLASLIVDFRRWPTLRLRALDLALLAWCGWPLLRAALTGDPASGLAPSAYMLAAWGGSWLIGKLYFAGEDGAAALLKAIAWSGVALLPVALLELVRGPTVYTLLYGRHPFSMDGIDRYVGYRPLAMFEDGNQYGVWMAMAAVAAIALARCDRRWRSTAIVLIVTSLASQSVGAILLLAVGVLALSGRVRIAARWWKAGTIATGAGAVLYLSGLVPFERIARHTSLGGHVLALVRSTGRGSLLWRVSQDQKVMPLLHQHLLIGWGRWDWWTPIGFRPWGVPMLVVGQFGVVGLALMIAVVLVAPVLVLARNGVGSAIGAVAIVAVMAAADAALNSFIFWPAIIAVGALGNCRSAQNASNTVDNRDRPLSMPRRNP